MDTTLPPARDDVRISVVLASYNGAAFIEAQLGSWLGLLGDTDEIIVSDDGSTDTTRDVVAALQARDPRVRLMRPGPRLGYQGNFARAIAEAHGRFVFFSDQDDVCLPARLEESLRLLQRAGCVGGDATVVNEALDVIAPSYFDMRGAGVFTAWQLFAKPAVIGATMACTREFLRAALPFPPGLPHDQWLSLLAAVKGQLAVSRQPFILYRRHAAVASSTAIHRPRKLRVILAERLQLGAALVRRLATGRNAGQPLT